MNRLGVSAAALLMALTCACSSSPPPSRYDEVAWAESQSLASSLEGADWQTAYVVDPCDESEMSGYIVVEPEKPAITEDGALAQVDRARRVIDDAGWTLSADRLSAASPHGAASAEFDSQVVDSDTNDTTITHFWLAIGLNAECT